MRWDEGSLLEGLGEIMMIGIEGGVKLKVVVFGIDDTEVVETVG